MNIFKHDSMSLLFSIWNLVAIVITTEYQHFYLEFVKCHHLLVHHLLSTYYVLGTILGT